MLKASVAHTLAYSCSVMNGDCFCFHLPLCPSRDVTWGVFLSLCPRAPGRWRAAVCPHSISRPESWVGAVWWFSVPQLTALPEGPSFLLASCPSFSHIQGPGYTEGLSVLACPLRPPVSVCPLPPSRPAFPPHTWLHCPSSCRLPVPCWPASRVQVSLHPESARGS